MLNLESNKLNEDPPCTLDRQINPSIQSVSFLTIDKFLSKDECDWLVSYGDQKELTLGLDRAGYKSDNRNSLISFLELKPELQWLTDKVTNKIKAINDKYMGWNLTHLDRYQYTTYNKDGYLSNHTDDYFDYISTNKDIEAKDLLVRKLSISILLSSPSEYAGGDLEIQAPKGTVTEAYDIRKLKPEKGTAIIFPSFYIHGVHPIIEGTRKSLIVWFFGPKWR